MVRTTIGPQQALNRALDTYIIRPKEEKRMKEEKTVQELIDEGRICPICYSEEHLCGQCETNLHREFEENEK